MHELSIASAVVDSVLEFLDAHEVKKVLTVRLAVGELSHVEADQLRFCYTAITQETADGEFNTRNRKCRRSGGVPALFLPRAPKILGGRALCRTDTDLGVSPLAEVPWNRWKEMTVRSRLSNSLAD